MAIWIYCMQVIWTKTPALAMAYSLQLADAHCEVMLVQDNKLSFLGLIVLVDNEYVLGYTYGVASQKSH